MMRFCLLIFISICYNGLAVSQIDSSRYIHALIKEAFTLYFVDNAKCCEKLSVALACAKRNDWEADVRRCRALINVCYESSHEFEVLSIEMLDLIREAEANYEKRTLAIAHANYGGMHHNTEQFNIGLEFYFKALEFTDSDKDMDVLAILYYSIAHLYFELEMWDQSILYARESVLNAKKSGLQNIEYISLDLLISNFDDVTDSLIHYQKLAEAVKKNLNDPYSNFLSFTTKGELFQTQELFDSAAFCFKQAYEIVLNKNDQYWICFTLAKLGWNEYLRKNYASAKDYFDKRNEALVEEGSWTESWKYNAAMIEYKLQNFERANQLFIEYFAFDEKIYAKENVQKTAFYNARFQKLQDENKIKEQELALEKRSNSQRWMLGGFLFLLSFISGLFYVKSKRDTFQKELLVKDAEIQKRRIDQLEVQKKLSNISSMIEGQEAERIRIAKDLHDGLGGLLSTVKIHFSKIQNEIEELENLAIYSKAQEMMDTACDEVRRISHNLMPATLRAKGLKSAVHQIASQLQDVYKVETTIEVNGFNKRLDETKEIFIYRILQEAANNIIKHAAATKVLIQLFRHEKNIQIVIEDNGLGFSQAEESPGIGLKSMESRVEHLNGSIEIDSREQVGTCIHVNIPLN